MATPLNDILRVVLRDPLARADFIADPRGVLADAGWSEVDIGGADLRDALALTALELPASEAVAFDRFRLGYGDDALAAADPLDVVLDELGSALSSPADPLATLPDFGETYPPLEPDPDDATDVLTPDLDHPDSELEGVGGLDETLDLLDDPDPADEGGEGFDA